MTERVKKYLSILELSYCSNAISFRHSEMDFLFYKTMKVIQLNRVLRTKNYLKHKAFVDDKDFDEVNSFNWNIHRMGYAESKAGSKKNILMHVFLLGKRDGYEIDHIDRNKLNNQRSNLRFVTKSQNLMNMRPHIDSASKYKGVSYSKRDKNYRAEIQVNGKKTFIRSSKNPVECAIAYNNKAKELFGEFANLNIIKL